MPANNKQAVLFITDKAFVDYTIPGGVQVCTAEFITYLQKADKLIKLVKVSPSPSLLVRIKAKLGLKDLELYNVNKYLNEIVAAINNDNIKLVFFNQLNLSHWAIKIKEKVGAEVKFIGLSHGNESGDYLHEITNTLHTSVLQTWQLGKIIVKEKIMFSKLLNGVVTISDNETYIDQWLGAANPLFLPRILKPNFINWQPKANTIGFVGTLNHLPNTAGIELVAQQLKLSNFTGTFKIVGSPAQIGYELEKKYSFIQYCGVLNNDDLMHEASSWSLFLNPVFWYARGSSTKLALGINWGIPIISTPAGTRGYDLHDRQFITANNTAKSFTQMVLNTLSSAELLGTVKQASVNNAQKFDVDVWAKKLLWYINEL